MLFYKGINAGKQDNGVLSFLASTGMCVFQQKTTLVGTVSKRIGGTVMQWLALSPHKRLDSSSQHGPFCVKFDPVSARVSMQRHAGYVTWRLVGVNVSSRVCLYVLINVC